MKAFIFTILCFILFQPCLSAQKQDKKEALVKEDTLLFGFAPITGAHFMTYKKGFNELNQQLMRINAPSVIPALNSIGLGFLAKNNKHCSFAEFSFIESRVWNRAFTKDDWLIPQISGLNIRSIFTKNIWERKKLRLDAGLGFSFSRYSFKMIDRRGTRAPLDTLLKYATQASATLDFSQKQSNWNIEGRFGLTYDTQWLKKQLAAFQLSMFINYSQTVYNSKKWVFTGTNIEVANFPKINFSNCYISFAACFYFKDR